MSHKPAKPSPDFPLFPHGNGQWAKKINGKMRYFGPWEDDRAALARYQQETQEAAEVQHVAVVAKGAEKSKAGTKPKKPHKDFPLFPHGNGQWAKQVKGKLHYFGTNADEALALWLEQKDDLLAGRVPVAKCIEKMPLRELVNRYLTSKKQSLEGGELAQRTYDQYEDDGERLLGFFGPTVIAERLGPTDFEKFRAAMAKTMKAVALGNAIMRTKMIFTYGAEMKLMTPVDYGPKFDRPSNKTLRKDREEKGEKFFTAEQINGMLKLADRQLTAMILLGINCGFGNEDCATLQQRYLDLEKGWHNYRRKKTGVKRSSPLWPETVAAIKECLAKRFKPKGDTHPDLIFVTRCGNSWSQNSMAITQEFKKILTKLGIEQKGHSFYSLRRTFETVGEESYDQAAVSFIMGHIAGREDMASTYRQKMTDERLLRVTNHVRGWLFKESLDSLSAAPVSAQPSPADAQSAAA